MDLCKLYRQPIKPYNHRCPPKRRTGYTLISKDGGWNYTYDANYTPSQASSCSSDIYDFPDLGDRGYGMRKGLIDVPLIGIEAVALTEKYSLAVPGSVTRNPIDISQKRGASPPPSPERRRIDAEALFPEGTEEEEQIKELEDRLGRKTKEIEDVEHLINYLVSQTKGCDDSKLHWEPPEDGMICPFRDIDDLVSILKRQIQGLDNAKEIAYAGLMQSELNQKAKSTRRTRLFQKLPVGPLISSCPDRGTGWKVRMELKEAQEVKLVGKTIQYPDQDPGNCFGRSYIDMFVSRQYNELKIIDLDLRDKAWMKRIAYLYKDMPIPVLLTHISGEEWLYAQLKQEYTWIHHLIMSPPEGRKKGFIRYLSNSKNLDVQLHSQLKLCGVLKKVLFDKLELEKRVRNIAIREWKAWKNDEKELVHWRQMEMDLRLSAQGTFDRVANVWYGVLFS